MKKKPKKNHCWLCGEHYDNCCCIEEELEDEDLKKEYGET